MALRLHGVAGDCAERGSGVAGAHEDGIGRVAEVMDACARPGLMCAYAIAWRRGKAKAGCGHGVWVGFKSHHG